MLPHRFRDDDSVDVGEIRKMNEGAQTINDQISNSFVRLPRNWRDAWTHQGNTPHGAHLYIDLRDPEWSDIRYSKIDDELSAAETHRQNIGREAAPAQTEMDVETGETKTEVPGQSESDARLEKEKQFHPADKDQSSGISEKEAKKWERKTGEKLEVTE
jgi:hypothetical protein